MRSCPNQTLRAREESAQKHLDELGMQQTSEHTGRNTLPLTMSPGQQTR